MSHPKVMTINDMADMSTRLYELGYKVPIISVQLWSGDEQFYVREWLERAERAKFKGTPAPHIRPFLLRYYQYIGKEPVAKKGA